MKMKDRRRNGFKREILTAGVLRKSSNNKTLHIVPKKLIGGVDCNLQSAGRQLNMTPLPPRE